MAVSRTFYGIGFPVFEVLRPIPPLAWVPASIIFWPTQELSIAFVTFLGAFFTVVINVIGGAQSIDVRYFQAARSMGSRAGNLPPHHPARHAALDHRRRHGRHRHHLGGGGRGGDDFGRRQPGHGRRRGGGLGFFIWNSYVGGSYDADRRRHDQHRHRRLHIERAAAQARRAGDAVAAAQRLMSERCT